MQLTGTIRRFLGVALVLGLVAGTARPVLAQNPPTGEELMDGYIKATGGKEAYDKVKTMIVKGTFGIMNINGDMLIHTKSPNLMHFSLSMPGVGNIEAGSDGKIMWENNPITGAKISDSSKEKDLIPGLDFSSDVNWKKVYKSATNEATEKVGGKDAYKVKLVDMKGETEHRFFDKATGLVIKLKKPMKSEIGNFVMDMDIGDYKKVGDLLMPHQVTAGLLGQKFQVQLTSVQLNVEIPESKSALPEAVKQLLKKKDDKGN
jgi:hypothetical protein